MSEPITYRIAVTGSQGQLGSEISRLAVNYPELQFYFLNREDFSLTDQDQMKSWLRQHSLDFLINCAAYTAVDKAESESGLAFQINAEAPGFIAALLAEKKTKLIHISTDYVFDGNSSVALTEEAATAPLNVYGASKLRGEELTLKNNPQTLLIRTSWVYSSCGNNFVKTMMRLMKDKPSIRVVQDQRGSPTYAADLAMAIIGIIRSGIFIPGIFNYSNEGETTWYDFALEIKKLIAISCVVQPIPSAEYPTPAKRPFYSLMDKSKIKKIYGLNIPEWKSSLAACIKLIKEKK